METSPIARSPQFPFTVGFQSKDVNFFVSKLYGTPRRRQISAIRDFPLGCRTDSASTSEERHEAGVSSLVPDGITGESKALVESNGTPSTLEVREKAKAASGVHSEAIITDIVKNSEDISTTLAFSSNNGTGSLKTTKLDQTSGESNGCGPDIKEDGLGLEAPSSSDPEICGNDLEASVVREPSAEGDTMVQIVKSEGKGEEVDPKAALPSQQQHVLKRYREVQFRGSKLYGPYKKRKISASRDFPPGCGPDIAYKQTEEHSEYVVTDGSDGGIERGRKNKILLEADVKAVDAVTEIKAMVETKGKTVKLENAHVSISEEVNGKLHAASEEHTHSFSQNILMDNNISEGKKEHGLFKKFNSALRRAEEMSEQIFDDFISKGNMGGTKMDVESSNRLASLPGRKKLKEHFREDSDIRTNKKSDDTEARTNKKPVDVRQNNIKYKKRKYKQEGGGEILPQERTENMDLESPEGKLIVQALMAAPYCPWRNGKHSSDATRSVGKVKKEKKISKKLPSFPSTSDSREIGLFTDQQGLPIDEESKHSPSPGPQELHVMVMPVEPPTPYDMKDSSGRDSPIRNRVRKALRLFQVICRKLLQEEESKTRQPGQSSRVDLRAANILKEKNEWVNTGKAILGIVPGVEVGDEFHYRTELSIVGLHRPFQAGIDYVKRGNSQLATSIVAGAGSDELDSSDVLIYSGSGGVSGSGEKPPEDQKLERGNLALKNSIEAKEPVRVIRGSKEMKTDRDGKAKPFSTFIYDGLYLVEKYWREKVPQGFFALKYQLRRIPGQPELAWKEIKKSKKPSARPGVCVKDISEGKEIIPICAVNTFDDERPQPFTYITNNIYPSFFSHNPPRGCTCTKGCSDSGKCACAVKNGGEIPFNYNGAIVQAKPLVYECGPSCKCPATCHNRVSQNGIKFQLEVFKTKSMGWGVRSLSSIPSGSFICEYMGELLPDSEAEERENDEYLFDIGHNYDDSSLWEGLPAIMPDSSSDALGESVKNMGFTIDAGKFGNVGRFINHSCSPNLYAQNVLYDYDERSIPHIMLFAAENIPPLQELTYHYNYKIDGVHDHNGNIKKKDCHCGSDECTGRLY